ncbi:hypothetical protein MXB_171, partial [Myxobolus squamalis]
MNEMTINRNIVIKVLCPSFVSLTDDLYGTIVVTGLSDKEDSILKAEALLVSYTGRNICKLYDATEKINCPDKRIDFKIKRDMLSSAVTEEFPFIKIKVYCFDSKHDELACYEKIISVKTPDVEISGIPDICKIDAGIVCTVSVLNTLNCALTHVRLNVKFTDDKTKRLRFKNIASGDKLV